MSTSMPFDFKAAAKAWPPWHAFNSAHFRVQSWCLEKKYEFKPNWSQSIWNTVHWSVEKNISGAAIPQSKKDTTPTSNAIKRVQASCATPAYFHCFWDRLKKPLQNGREENQSVGPWCLWLWHRWSGNRWGRGRLLNSNAWSYDLSSASPPVPSRMQLCSAALRFHTRLPPWQHLLTLDPSPPHLGPFIAAAPIVRQIDVNDRSVRLQGFG